MLLLRAPSRLPSPQNRGRDFEQVLPTMSTRREFLVSAASLGAGTSLLGAAREADATPAQMQEALRKIAGNATVRRGRVKLDLPPLIDNGNAVPMTVTIESPMTATDYVKAIHVITEKNPQP